jgi:hypothetical protein
VIVNVKGLVAISDSFAAFAVKLFVWPSFASFASFAVKLFVLPSFASFASFAVKLFCVALLCVLRGKALVF